MICLHLTSYKKIEDKLTQETLYFIFFAGQAYLYRYLMLVVPLQYLGNI